MSSAGHGALAILDVHYFDPAARAACVVAVDAAAARGIEERVLDVPHVAPYVPGRFYQRELPCLIAALAEVQSSFELLVVDGYVVLDAAGRPGLGSHLYQYFSGKYPVIGVAKTAFAGASFAAPVLRARSKKPLFVTAAGLPLSTAAQLVASMHGATRIPSLLKRADQLARGLAASGA